MDEKCEHLTFVKSSQFEGKTFLVFLSDNHEFRVCEQWDYLAFQPIPGTKIKARIQQKGCAGNEITELLHPFYDENKSYPFVVKRCGAVGTGVEMIQFVVVASNHGDEFRIPVENKDAWNPGQMVNCLLTGQKQGKLFFKILN